MSLSGGLQRRYYAGGLLLTDEPRRQYYERGQYLGSLLKWINSGDLQKAKVILEGLVRYPDLFFGQVLPSVVREPKPKGESFKVMWEVADELTRERLRKRVLEILEQPGETTYSALRVLAWFSSVIMGAHPAMRMPPVTVEVQPGLSTTKFPLTRYQIGWLKQDESLQGSHPIRPYTLSSREEAMEIIKLLNEQFGDGGKWRLPSESERRNFLAMTPGHWPWGDADPERGEHAHLEFRGHGGAIAQHPVEVGVFRRDTGPLRDLIGNVYEVVVCGAAGSELGLAGGSWTTAFQDSTTSRFAMISYWSTGRRNNVGIRPVFQQNRRS